VKDDQLDAGALADALRLDEGHWRALASEVPWIQELRLLCRDEVALIAQRPGWSISPGSAARVLRCSVAGV
jgi:hypothetical protein